MLSGINENTFTGSGNNVVVDSEGHSHVASSTTWTVGTSSGVTLEANGANSITVDGTMDLDSGLVFITDGFPAVPVNGTVSISSGVVVKSQSNTAAFQVTLVAHLMALVHLVAQLHLRVSTTTVSEEVQGVVLPQQLITVKQLSLTMVL